MNSLELADQAFRAGDLAGAIGLCSGHLRDKPRDPGALHLMAILLQHNGRQAEALVMIGKALEIERRADYLNTMGLVYKSLCRYNEAESALLEATGLEPDKPEYRRNLANLYAESNSPGRAETIYRDMIGRNPDDATALLNLGLLYFRMFRLDDAANFLERAASFATHHADATLGLIDVLFVCGRAREARELSLRLLESSPGNLAAARKLLLVELVHETDPAILKKTHARVGGMLADRFSQPYRSWPAVAGKKPVKLGILSADLRQHSIGYFLLPFLENIDRSEFRITLYSLTSTTDDFSKRYRNVSDNWKDVTAMTTESIAGLIHEDGTNILFDISSHMKDAMPGVCCLRPAPVIISWLGYPGTTGIAQVNYRITHSDCDPPPSASAEHVETLLYLPESFLCYQPLPGSPAVAELPCRKNSFVTFGVFNSAAKYTDEMLACWGKILGAVPSARLLVKDKYLANEQGRNRLLTRLDAAGVDTGRTDLHGWLQNSNQALDAYSSVDISLDTFPYNGTTTTFESLWMGVPVITLAGRRHASRVSAHILATLGYNDWIVADARDYIQRATALAGDPVKLEGLRSQIRPVLEASCLMDCAGFTRAMEDLLRQVWSQYRQ